MNAFYIICGLGVASLVAEIINVKKGLILFLIAGILVAGVAISVDWNTTQHYFSDMVVFDNSAIAFTILICVIGALWFWLAKDYFHEETHLTDQAALIIFALAGAILLSSFNNMAMLFLGIEILSIPLYILAGSKKANLASNEASFKYFLMGSFATGFLLMGIALIYGATASFDLTKIGAYVSSHPADLPQFFYVGVLMVLVGMAFKISAVPFHFWAPDVYEGSPTVITAFMSTVVKIAAFAAFYRLFAYGFVAVSSIWFIPIGIITVLTLVIPNVTAVFQSNVKRMLAYSSVGHAGYVLLAFLGGVEHSLSVIFFYLSVYAVASLSAFTVMIQLEKAGLDGSLKSFNGLFKKNSFLAVVMTISLLSLAGIPPLAGFFGKYLVFSLAMHQGYTGLVILAVVTSLIGVYYYFRVIVAMFMADTTDDQLIPTIRSHRALMFILLALAIGLGVFPDILKIL